MINIGKFFLIIGLIFVVIGFLIWGLSYFNINFLGRLPGDFLIKRKNFTLYFPLTTGLIISLIISGILYFLSHR